MRTDYNWHTIIQNMSRFFPNNRPSAHNISHKSSAANTQRQRKRTTTNSHNDKFTIYANVADTSRDSIHNLLDSNKSRQKINRMKQTLSDLQALRGGIATAHGRSPVTMGSCDNNNLNIGSWKSDELKANEPKSMKSSYTKAKQSTQQKFIHGLHQETKTHLSSKISLRAQQHLNSQQISPQLQKNERHRSNKYDYIEEREEISNNSEIEEDQFIEEEYYNDQIRRQPMSMPLQMRQSKDGIMRREQSTLQNLQVMPEKYSHSISLNNHARYFQHSQDPMDDRVRRRGRSDAQIEHSNKSASFNRLGWDTSAISTQNHKRHHHEDILDYNRKLDLMVERLEMISMKNGEPFNDSINFNRKYNGRNQSQYGDRTPTKFSKGGSHSTSLHSTKAYAQKGTATVTDKNSSQRLVSRNRQPLQAPSFNGNEQYKNGEYDELSQKIKQCHLKSYQINHHISRQHYEGTKSDTGNRAVSRERRLKVQNNSTSKKQWFESRQEEIQEISNALIMRKRGKTLNVGRSPNRRDIFEGLDDGGSLFSRRQQIQEEEDGEDEEAYNQGRNHQIDAHFRRKKYHRQEVVYGNTESEPVQIQEDKRNNLYFKQRQESSSRNKSEKKLISSQERIYPTASQMPKQISRSKSPLPPRDPSRKKQRSNDKIQSKQTNSRSGDKRSVQAIKPDPVKSQQRVKSTEKQRQSIKEDKSRQRKYPNFIKQAPSIQPPLTLMNKPALVNEYPSSPPFHLQSQQDKRNKQDESISKILADDNLFTLSQNTGNIEPVLKFDKDKLMITLSKPHRALTTKMILNSSSPSIINVYTSSRDYTVSHTQITTSGLTFSNIKTKQLYRHRGAVHNICLTKDIIYSIGSDSYLKWYLLATGQTNFWKFPPKISTPEPSHQLSIGALLQIIDISENSSQNRRLAIMTFNAIVIVKHVQPNKNTQSIVVEHAFEIKSGVMLQSDKKTTNSVLFYQKHQRAKKLLVGTSSGLLSIDNIDDPTCKINNLTNPQTLQQTLLRDVANIWVSPPEQKTYGNSKTQNTLNEFALQWNRQSNQIILTANTVSTLNGEVTKCEKYSIILPTNPEISSSGTENQIQIVGHCWKNIAHHRFDRANQQESLLLFTSRDNEQNAGHFVINIKHKSPKSNNHSIPVSEAILAVRMPFQISLSNKICSIQSCGETILLSDKQGHIYAYNHMEAGSEKSSRQPQLYPRLGTR